MEAALLGVRRCAVRSATRLARHGEPACLALALLTLLGCAVKELAPPPESFHFAHKHNFLNVFFVKRAWGWMLLPLVPLVAVTAGVGGPPRGGLRGGLGPHAARLLVATAVWFVATEVFVVIDQITGSCHAATTTTTTGTTTAAATAATTATTATAPPPPLAAVDRRACQRLGGSWSGVDISGHAFLLTYCLLLGLEELRGALAFTQRQRAHDGGGGRHGDGRHDDGGGRHDDGGGGRHDGGGGGRDDDGGRHDGGGGRHDDGRHDDGGGGRHDGGGGGRDDDGGRHDGGGGRHDDGRHDDGGGGRHDDGRHDGGGGRHDGGRHDDGGGRHDDGRHDDRGGRHNAGGGRHDGGRHDTRYRPTCRPAIRPADARRLSPSSSSSSSQGPTAGDGWPTVLVEALCVPTLLALMSLWAAALAGTCLYHHEAWHKVVGAAVAYAAWLATYRRWYLRSGWVAPPGGAGGTETRGDS
ncbi:uncharacterized protein LOC144952786 [Lampetra fluviatilis]